MKNYRKTPISAGVLGTLTLLTGSGIAHAALIQFQTVALTGTDGSAGPGEGAGITFSTLGGQQPSINDQNKIAFRGADSTTGNPAGVWINSAATNGVVAQANGAQPGGGTYSTAGFNSVALTDSGVASWRLGASTGAFSTAGRLMLSGDPAPDTSSSSTLAAYNALASGMPLLNRNGQSAYISSLTVTAATTPPVVVTSGIANASGLWTGTTGNTHLALRQNDPVTSLDSTGGIRVGSLSNLTLSYNDNNSFAVQTALQGNVTTGTGAGANSTAILTNRGGSLSVVARAGDAAVDATGALSATDQYRVFGTQAVGLNDAGHVAFMSSLKNAAGTQTATSAMFTDAYSGTLRMVGKTGDALPTVYSPSGAVLSSYSGVTWSAFTDTLLSGSDEPLFSATLTNTGATTNTRGLFTLDKSGLLHSVVRSGDLAIAGGAPDGSDATFATFPNETVDDAGIIAFMSTLTGTNVNATVGNNSALFEEQPDGTLTKIARTGDSFLVAPGDSRIISAIGGIVTTGGEDGRADNLNNAGSITYELDFQGGTSGIFVANVSVPEPASLSILATSALLLGRKRRTRNA